MTGTAVVTGAGRGIGRAIAEALASAGAKVALTARTTRELDDVRAFFGVVLQDAEHSQSRSE